MAGILRYSAIHGRWRFYYRQPSYLNESGTVNLREFELWKPDGVVCSFAQSKLLAKLCVPMVCYDSGNYTGEIPCIVTDDKAVGELAGRHLINLGHRHFAFCGFSALKWSEARSESFCKIVEEAGFRADVAPTTKEQSRAEEEPTLRQWIEQLPKPVGIFCANDDRAAPIADICLSLGLVIPEDVSIIGADNDEMICEIMYPTLSSVRITSDQAGYEAADLLAKLIARSETAQGQSIVAKAAGVLTRQSTSLLMVKNVSLRKAIEFIRQNVSQQLRVTDVVASAGLSHRSLNERFHEELNTSIGKYLTHARIEHITKLLIETDMQVQEVAYAVGYEDDRHFSRYFKRETGYSPMAFRKKHRTR